MNRDFQATFKTGSITLPDAMVQQSHLKDGDVLDIVALSADRFTVMRAAAHRGLFKVDATVTKEQVQTYLVKQGYAARSDDPDVYERQVSRTTAEGKALGKLYMVQVRLSDLMAHPEQLAAFVRHHH